MVFFFFFCIWFLVSLCFLLTLPLLYWKIVILTSHDKHLSNHIVLEQKLCQRCSNACKRSGEWATQAAYIAQEVGDCIHFSKYGIFLLIDREEMAKVLIAPFLFPHLHLNGVRIRLVDLKLFFSLKWSPMISRVNGIWNHIGCIFNLSICAQLVLKHNWNFLKFWDRM